MVRVGFVGWRGMVGSVLIDRMGEENDFKRFHSTFFTTSQTGQPAPKIGGDQEENLQDAHNIDLLSKMDALVVCQGGDYSSEIYPKLKTAGWQGFWIDAASSFRMDEDSIICLDPVNMDIIQKGIASGVKKFIGGNCTVSLMLMALGGLFKENLIEWLSATTYQSASGGGARHMKELITQMHQIGEKATAVLGDKSKGILDLDANVSTTLQGTDLNTECFGAPLAGNLIPWIDRKMETGQTREEWKAEVEGNKILQPTIPIPMDGVCVRVGTMRCHSQAFTIKLKQNLSVEEITRIIAEGSSWVEVIPNEKEETLAKLTPAAVNGTLKIPVGRIRKLSLGDNFISAFSVGDQLLWGAAEPLRRVLKIILDS